MRISLLCNRDLASNYALNHLLPELAEQHSLQVFLSSQVGAAKATGTDLDTLKFYEQGLFNDILFPALDESSSEAESGAELLTFHGLSRYTTSAVSTLNRINSDESLATLRASQPDLILSIRYGGILHEHAIAIPRLGVINLHSGVLPDYRGVMATFRALAAGEDKLGCTLHYISDAKIDTGAVIAQTQQASQAEQSYLQQVLNLYPTACSELLAAVQQLNDGHKLPAQPQTGVGTYYSFPDNKDLQDFTLRGLRLYDAQHITQFAKRYMGATR